MIKVIIIDDESDARQLLKTFIAEHDDIQIVGEADSLKNGVSLLTNTTPDLLFLDVELKDGTGFDLLSHFPNATFLTIFVTAFDAFALKAFRFNAIDYILKPATPDDVEQALMKAKHQLNTHQNIQHQINALLQTVKEKKIDKLVLHTAEGIHFIPLTEVIYLSSEGNYTTVVSNQGKVLVTQNLGAFDYLEEDSRFFRTHQSYIVNMTYVRQFLRHPDGEYAVVNDGIKIPISRRKKEAFIERMKQGF